MKTIRRGREKAAIPLVTNGNTHNAALAAEVVAALDKEPTTTEIVLVHPRNGESSPTMLCGFEQGTDYTMTDVLFGLQAVSGVLADLIHAMNGSMLDVADLPAASLGLSSAAKVLSGILIDREMTGCPITKITPKAAAKAEVSDAAAA
jgi:hypothetical protein